ncbi:MAG TPA: hypothetical protein VLG27_00070 [Candidatus Saccharimonadia bacterium]|nr:hypothetical protein [Candidatus Saccharimonadia bacterium]
MARAVGTMGAIAALVGGVTFAALQSNTVALSPNTLSSATAALAIGAGTSCPGGNTTSTPGFTNVKLVPGTTSAPVNFCLDNTGDIPLTITAQIPTNFTGSVIAPNQVTLTLNCPTIGQLSGTLDQYSSPVNFPGSQLPTNSPVNCTATATLNSSFSGSGSVKSFDIDFVGNQ